MTAALFFILMLASLAGGASLALWTVNWMFRAVREVLADRHLRHAQRAH